MPSDMSIFSIIIILSLFFKILLSSFFTGSFPTTLRLPVPSPVKENDYEAAKMKSLNAAKSHRLLDFVPSIKPSFLSVILAFVCGCLWLKNETTNERLFALESRIDYLPCVNMVKRVSFEKMTRSSTKVTSKDLYKKMRTHFSEGIPHTSGKIGAVC